MYYKFINIQLLIPLIMSNKAFISVHTLINKSWLSLILLLGIKKKIIIYCLNGEIIKVNRLFSEVSIVTSNKKVFPYKYTQC